MFLGSIERDQWNEMFERFRFVPSSGLYINLTLSIFKTTRKLFSYETSNTYFNGS